MRICIRCGAEMREGCALKVEGGAYELQICKEEGAWFGGPRWQSAPSAGNFPFTQMRTSCGSCKYCALADGSHILYINQQTPGGKQSFPPGVSYPHIRC